MQLDYLFLHWSLQSFFSHAHTIWIVLHHSFLKLWNHMPLPNLILHNLTTQPYQYYYFFYNCLAWLNPLIDQKNLDYMAMWMFFSLDKTRILQVFHAWGIPWEGTLGIRSSAQFHGRRLWESGVQLCCTPCRDSELSEHGKALHIKSGIEVGWNQNGEFPSK